MHESSVTHRVPTPGEIHLPHWNKMRQEPRVSDQKKCWIWAKIQIVKLFKTWSTSCRIYATWRTFTSNHEHMSSAKFKKRTTHLDIPGKVYDFHQHVVKTCPFCYSTKPRPDRSRVSGLRAEEQKNLERHFLGSWFDEEWRSNLWILGCFGWCHCTFNQKSSPNFMSGWILFRLHLPSWCARQRRWKTLR